MELATLEDHRRGVEQRFDELDKQKSDIIVELHRLQGEYRLLNDLIEDINKDKGEDNVSGTEPGRPEEPAS